jgi:co-chaperonin GroES (HSP10)
MNVISLEYYPYLLGKVIETMDIQPGHSILNLGSGTGRNICFIARKIDLDGSILEPDINRDRELSLESTKFDLIEPEEVEESTSKASTIPSDRVKEKPRRGKVVKVGMDDELAGKIEVEDRIVYAKFCGDAVELEDEKYPIKSRSNIITVTE